MSQKAIFLDRDETLIKDPGYISSPDQVELLDGVPEALVKLRELGYKLIVVSNQSAVARGIVTEKVLGKIHDRLKQLLAEKDAHLDRIYYCPYHPDGIVPKYRKESNNRKPNPGMLLTAAKDMDIDLEQSWCIGNSIRDIEAGKRAGCKTILIDSLSHQKQPETHTAKSDIKPDYKGVNLREAVNIIKKYLRSSARTPIQAQTNPAIADEPSEISAETTNDEVKPVSETTEPVIEVPESSPDEETSSEANEPEQIIAEPTSGFDVHKPQREREQKRTRMTPEETNTNNNRTEQLLVDILGQLKSMHRTEMFSEFSIMRLMAGIMQIIVLFCLLITVWYLMSPESRPNSVFIALGFAIVFQLMSLTFYIMHSRK
jgi:D-glycero-D-manno-heptose 1,7-bisphosphate phosphatase